MLPLSMLILTKNKPKSWFIFSESGTFIYWYTYILQYNLEYSFVEQFDITRKIIYSFIQSFKKMMSVVFNNYNMPGTVIGVWGTKTISKRLPIVSNYSRQGEWDKF